MQHFSSTIFFRIVIAVFFLSAGSACAAEVSLAPIGKAAVGNPFLIDVLVDTEGESINSAEVTVSFNPEVYEFAGYTTGDGAIGLWVTAPRETEAGRVQFSGVILGGIERLYDPHAPSDHAVPLARLRFTPKETGASSFAVTRATLLRNDGIGSPVTARTSGTTVAIAPSTSAVSGTVASDEVPPLPFTIAIVEHSSLGKSPRLAVFDARDEESGVRAYEIRINGGRPREVQSPYELPRRLFPYTLTARAIDFAGNYREAEVTVRGGASGLPAVIVAVVLLGIVWYRRRVRRQASIL